MVTVTALISWQSQSVIKTMVFYLLSAADDRVCTAASQSSQILHNRSSQLRCFGYHGNFIGSSYHFVSRESGWERGIGGGTSSYGLWCSWNHVCFAAFTPFFSAFWLKVICFFQYIWLPCWPSFVMTHISSVMIIARSLRTKMIKIKTKLEQWPAASSQKDSNFTLSSLHILLSGQQSLW